MKKTDRSSQLLIGIYHDDWAGGTPAALAREAAAAARQRRASRGRELAGLVALAAAIAVVFSQFRSVAPVAAAGLRLSSPPSAPVSLGYEIISDDELLTQLRDRPLLVLPKENGAREFVFLDRPADGP